MYYFDNEGKNEETQLVWILFIFSLLPLYLWRSLQFIYLFIWPYRVACGILVPWPGIEPGPWQWQSRVQTTGPPGNSQELIIYKGGLKVVYYRNSSAGEFLTMSNIGF